jgi:hypothetical protein
VLKIGNGEHEFAETRVEFSDFCIVLGDSLGNVFHFRKQRCRVFTRALAARDLFAGFVAICFETLDCGYGFAALDVKFAESGDVNLNASIAGQNFELIGMFAKVC